MDWQQILLGMGSIISAALTARIGFSAWSRRQTASALVPAARKTILASLTDGAVVLDAQGRVVDMNPAARLMLDQTMDQVIGTQMAHMLDYAETLKRAKGTQEVRAEFIHSERGIQCTIELRLLPLFDKRNHNAGQLMLLRNISERKALEQREEEHARELQRQYRRQAALARLGLAINQAQKLEDVLDQVARITAELVPASAGASVILWDAQAQRFAMCASTLPELKDPTSLKNIGENAGAARWVVEHSEPLVVTDIHEGAADAHPILAELNVQAYVTIPLIADGQALGALNVMDRIPRQYTQQDIDFLMEIATRAASAIKTARLVQKVQEFATMDELTAIANRRYLFESGEREMRRAGRFRHSLTALMLDIDHLNKVKETHGQRAGDQVLQAIARYLQQSLREIDLVGRYGGEEFAVVLPETELAAACETAERLRKNIADLPVTTEKGPLYVTVSVGVAELTEQTLDFSALLNSADAAMFKAKQAGRNRVFYADHSLARHFYIDYLPA